MKLETALMEIEAELRRATLLHGPFHNAHEGYAVFLEEVDEVKKNPSKHPERLQRIQEEATQAAAMATRILVDVCP